MEAFAAEVGMECVSLLGSQLAPEDIIGVPQIVDGYMFAVALGSVAGYADSRDVPYARVIIFE